MFPREPTASPPLQDSSPPRRLLWVKAGSPFQRCLLLQGSWRPCYDVGSLPSRHCCNNRGLNSVSFQVGTQSLAGSFSLFLSALSLIWRLRASWARAAVLQPGASSAELGTGFLPVFAATPRLPLPVSSRSLTGLGKRDCFEAGSPALCFLSQSAAIPSQSVCLLPRARRTGCCSMQSR